LVKRASYKVIRHRVYNQYWEIY